MLAFAICGIRTNAVGSFNILHIYHKPYKMISKPLLLVTIAISVVNFHLKAQHNREFEISLPETKATGSLYNKISFLDSREDSSQMGILQTGAFNRKAAVVTKTPLPVQLNKLMSALVDSTAKDGELLFQLRQLSFAEVTGAMSEKGYFFFRAILYAKAGQSYTMLASIDTAIIIKSSLDVTKGIFKRGSNLVSSFVSNHLLQTSNTAGVTFSDVVKIDSIEKAGLKIYSDTGWQNGIYSSWNSFKQQLPDKPVLESVIKEGKLKTLKIMGDDNKLEKVKSRSIYAVVCNGQPFIATDYGYYPLEKTNGEIFFTGKAKVTASTGDVIAASMFFGIIGGLLASDAAATFEMKIDHLSGGFIRLREIKTVGTE